MTLSGLAAAGDELMGRAEGEAAELLEKLKEKVQSEIKDVGTLRKELRVTVPAEVVKDRLQHDYDELRNEAVVPGFRKGRAPLALIEKRFGSEVRDSLKTSIIGQSFMAVVEKENIEVLGDPLFRISREDGERYVDLGEALSALDLAPDGDFSYVCEVEVKPEFEVPELKGIEVKRPQVEITDKMVDEQILRQRKIRGRYEVVNEGKARDPEDLLVADVRLLVAGNVVKEEANVQLGVRPTRLDGIALTTLGEDLKGVGPGDERKVECKVPDDYERPDLRGQDGVFEFKVHELKRQVPAPLETFIEQMGCTSEQELRDSVRDDLEAERDQIVQRAMNEQVLEYLLNSVSLDIPENLSARQTDRAVMRKVIDLQQRGTPESEIETHIDELRTSAREEVARDLKLEFILEKVAEQLDVSVTDEEVNTRIAQVARLYNRRFDRVRDDLQNRGLLSQLAEQIRQDKCVAVLLSEAKVVDVDESKAADTSEE